MSRYPAGWAEVALRAINEFAGRTIDPSLQPEQTFELYSVPAFPSGVPERLVGAAIGSTKQTVAPSDVLVCKINPRINRVWQVAASDGLPQIASSEWIAVRSSHVEARYLRHYFTSPSFRELICDGVTGVGGSLTRAQPKRVAEFSVPIAPLGEQQRISDKLDALLARVGACRDRLDRIPPILKRFKQAVLRAACSGAMSYKPEIASGSSHETLSQIGPFSIPADWELVPLKELVDNFDAKRVPVRAGDRATRQGAYPYYGAFGVIDHVDDYLFDGDFLLVAEDGKNLATRDRPISLIARGKFWVNNHAHVLKTRGHMRVEYLNHWINSDACDLSPLLTGIDQVKLTRAAMDSILVPCPPVEEQGEIVRRVESLFALADAIEAKWQAIHGQVECLTPALLAKAFRGELVPQDPNDEPAAELLNCLAAQREATPARPRRQRAVI